MTQMTPITLNLQAPNVNVIVHAKEGDRAGRYMNARLVDGTTAFIPPENAHFVVRYMKADGNGGLYDTMEDNETPAVTLSGNIATIGIAEQALTLQGRVAMELNIYDHTGTRISAFTFTLMVEETVMPDGNVESTEYFNILTHEIALALQASDVVQAVVDMTVEAVELPAGSTPTVEKDYDPDAGTLKLTFGLVTGDDGKSAYQSAVDGGYQGTEAQFNVELAGLNAAATAAQAAAAAAAQSKADVQALAETISGSVGIDDDYTGNATTWSSNKINEKFIETKEEVFTSEAIKVTESGTVTGTGTFTAACIGNSKVKFFGTSGSATRYVRCFGGKLDALTSSSKPTDKELNPGVYRISIKRLQGNTERGLIITSTSPGDTTNRITAADGDIIDVKAKSMITVSTGANKDYGTEENPTIYEYHIYEIMAKDETARDAITAETARATAAETQLAQGIEQNEENLINREIKPTASGSVTPSGTCVVECIGNSRIKIYGTTEGAARYVRLFDGKLATLLPNTNPTDKELLPGTYRFTIECIQGRQDRNTLIATPTSGGDTERRRGIENGTLLTIDENNMVVFPTGSYQNYGTEEEPTIYEYHIYCLSVKTALTELDERLTQQIDRKFGYQRALHTDDSIDSIYTPGVYRWTNANTPADSPVRNYATLFVYGPFADSKEGKTAILLDAYTGDILTRYSQDSGWQPWKYHRATNKDDDGKNHDAPETFGQMSVINRAYQMAKATYIAEDTFYLHQGGSISVTPADVPVGTEIVGIPYSSMRETMASVPQAASFHTFFTAVHDKNSYLYTKHYEGTAPLYDYNSRCYYGAVCSTLVAYCYGIDDVIPTTISFDDYPGMNKLSDNQQNPYSLKLADMLNHSSDHIVIVTDIVRNYRGIVTEIEVTEAWKPLCRSMRYTPAQIQSRYFDEGYFAYRYERINDVTYEPSPWIHIYSSETGIPEYVEEICPRKGDKSNWSTDETVEIDVIESDGFTGYQVTNLDSGSVVKSGEIPSDKIISLVEIPYGRYECHLTGSEDSDSVYFNVIKNNIEYTPVGNHKVKIDFTINGGTPSAVYWLANKRTSSGYKAVVSYYLLTDEEIEAGTVTIDEPQEYRAEHSDNGKWLMRMCSKTEFGLFASDYVVVNVT